MSDYLLRLICAAILCALVEALSGTGGIRRLTAGIFLPLVAFSVPVRIELPEFDPASLKRDAEIAASEGMEQAQTARADIITEALGAYVWSKAQALGLEVTAQIELDGELRPVRLELTGDASPRERELLLGTLIRDLGLTEEAVTWTQVYQSRE